MLIENIKLSITGLLANKIRSFLTMLGIIIGIASVIAIMVISDAMIQTTMSSIGDMGANRIEVYIMQKNNDDANVREMKRKDYLDEDKLKETLERFHGKISGFALEKDIGSARIEGKTAKMFANVSLKGENAHAMAEKHLKIVAGRNLNVGDQEKMQKVALVSNRYAEKMFHGDISKAPGEEIEVPIENKYYSYTIVGVYDYVEQGFSAGGNMDEQPTDVYIPLSVARLQIKDGDLVDSFTAYGVTGVDPGSVCTELQDYINKNFYQNNDAYECFAYSMKEQLRQMNDMLGTEKLVFMAIGGIALLVGGIGVMNIMIVSITERTREIGTRKALGATNNDIRLQFITEAIVICLIGGIIGILFGLGFGMVASSMLGVKGYASPSGIIFCVFFSMAFGVFFGYYPANKAAKLNPIEALRYE